MASFKTFHGRAARPYVIGSWLIALLTLGPGLLFIWYSTDTLGTPRTAEEALKGPGAQALLAKGIPPESLATFTECAEYENEFHPMKLSPVIPRDCTAFPLVDSQGWEGKIEFDSVRSVHGKWRGEAPTLSLDLPDASAAEWQTQTTRWGDDLGPPLVGDMFKTRWVWMWGSIPPPGPGTLHTTLSGRARLDVTYPADAGYQAFRNLNSTMSRTIEFFVVTPEEMGEMEAAAVHMDRAMTILDGILGGLFLVISATSTGVALRWNRQLREKGFIRVLE